MPMRPTLLRHAAALALSAHIAWPAPAQAVVASMSDDMPNGDGQASLGSSNGCDKACA